MEILCQNLSHSINLVLDSIYKFWILTDEFSTRGTSYSFDAQK